MDLQSANYISDRRNEREHAGVCERARALTRLCTSESTTALKAHLQRDCASVAVPVALARAWENQRFLMPHKTLIP